jgi:RND family efflux transporter MFP subunit
MNKWILFSLASFVPQTIWAADIQAILQWSHRVELSTPVSGVIKTVDIEVGDMVKKGQVLLSLDTTSFRARVDESQSEIIRMKAELAESKRELDRIQELYERTIVSTTDLDHAKLQVVKSQSTLSEAQARLRQHQQMLADASIHAPYDAVVVIRQAEPGQSVAAGLQPKMLLTLARSGEMIARMHLTSLQIDKLKINQTVTVSTAGESYTGKIKSLGMEPVIINEQSVYPVDVIFPVKESLRAGVAALVTIP